MSSSISLEPERHASQPKSVWMLALAALAASGAASMFAVDAKLPALALAAAAIGLMLLAFPNAAILIFVFVIYTNAAVIAVHFHDVPHFAGAATVALLGLPLFYQVVIQRKEIVIAPALPFVVAFITVRLVGTLVAQRQDEAITAATTTVTEGLILYLLVTNVVRDMKILRGVVWTLAIAGAFLGTLTAVQQWTGNFSNNYGGFAQADIDPKLLLLQKVPTPRSGGPVGEKNYYAQFMLMLVPLALSRVWAEKNLWLRLAGLGAAFLTALGVVFTASRGAAIGFVVMVFAMLVLRQIRWRTAGLVAAAGIVLLLSSSTFRERLIESATLLGLVKTEPDIRLVDRSSQGRITEMFAAIMVFGEHPVLGVGPANFPAHFLEKANALGFPGTHMEERLAHCSYLELAAESGIVGLLAYLGILFVTVRELVRARHVAASPETMNMASAMLVTMIVMIFTALLLSFAYERYYWFMLALAGACARVVQRHTPEATTMNGSEVHAGGH